MARGGLSTGFLPSSAEVEAAPTVDRAVTTGNEGDHRALAAVGADGRIATLRSTAGVAPVTAAVPRSIAAIHRAWIEQVGVAGGAALLPATRAPDRRRHPLFGAESLLGDGVEKRIAAFRAAALFGALVMVRDG